MSEEGTKFKVCWGFFFCFLVVFFLTVRKSRWIGMGLCKDCIKPYGTFPSLVCLNNWLWAQTLTNRSLSKFQDKLCFNFFFFLLTWTSRSSRAAVAVATGRSSLNDQPEGQSYQGWNDQKLIFNLNPLICLKTCSSLCISSCLVDLLQK